MSHLEREYTEYEKRILKLNEDLCAAVKDSVEGGGTTDQLNQVNKVLDAWRAEWKNAPYDTNPNQGA